MRILHLSDFHFKSSERDQVSQNLIVERLIENLDSDIKVDFLFFTGDLVFSGEKKEDFKSAYEIFLKKVGLKLGIPKRNAILCAGNHDVDRKKVSDPVRDYIRRSSTSDDLFKIVDKNQPDVFGVSCKPTEVFFEFQTNFYEKAIMSGSDVVTPLYSIHIRQLESGQDVGIATINTAWCSTGNDDKGNLFFPKCELEKVIEYLNTKKVSWKILLLHHPLTDLRDFNRIDIEDLIYSEFHFMFSGHLHKREDFIRLMQNEGIFGTYAHAAFTKKEDGKIGYSIFDIDLQTLEIKVQKYIYDFDESVFLPLKVMTFIFPCNETKSDQIKIFKTLRKRLQETIDKANELCVNNSGQSHSNGFFELFVDPVLKSKPQVEAAASLSQSPRLEFKSLFESKNYFIYGKDKTGKTSLLFKLMIDLLSSFSQLGEIPIYIDMNEYKGDPKKFNIQRIVSKFIDHTYAETDKILRAYKFKLLIDNFDPNKRDFIQNISSFIGAYQNCNYVILADQTIAQSYEQIDYGLDGYEKLFIHDISRTEIRHLTKKWPSIPEDKRDEFVERIVDVLKQHSMPFNFWTLSIFLLIFSGKNTLNFNNNSELLELYIDDILDRNRLASDPQNRFSYSNYKSLLAELAFVLLTNYRETNHSILYADLIQFVERFKAENSRRVGNTSEIVAHLIERGVFKRLDGDFVTFRLNGVFEYFIAFSFLEKTDFFNEIIMDDNYYLSFKNEFEIYSGFQHNERDSRDFLDKIYCKTKNAFKELNDRMIGDLDMRLKNSISGKNVVDLTGPINQIANSGDLVPLNDTEKDEFLDEINSGIIRDVEVKPKVIYDVSIKKFDILERYLMINGRVFKNIDNIKDSKYVEEIFDFIIDSSCNLGFLLIEELESNVDEQKLEDLDYSSSKKVIFQLISNYLPSVVQSFIHDSSGHINLELLINNKIENYKKDFHNNQFKIYILYCLLLDIDLKKYKHKIDDLIKYTRMGVIKSSILIKLCYLLLFKSYDDDDMIALLKEKMRTISLSINPNIDMKDFEKKFEKTKKILLLKRLNK